MNNSNQNIVESPPPKDFPMSPPPPIGYPVKDGQEDQGQALSATTRSRGDGCCKEILVRTFAAAFTRRNVSEGF
ncbi:hypothetical protein OROHE_012734 [Orobanche hederae]